MTNQPKKYTATDLEQIVNQAQVTKPSANGAPAEAVVTLSNQPALDAVASKQIERIVEPRQMAQVPTVTRDTMDDQDRPEPVKAILPSRGLHYGTASKFGAIPTISNGEIWVRPWTFREQKMFLKPEIIQSGALLDAVLYSCIATGGVDVTRLLSSDRTYLFWFARSLTYGDEYKYSWMCGNQFCRKRENDEMVKIGEMPIIWAADEVEEPFEYKLYTGHTVQLRFARGYDENASYSDSMRKENDKMLRNDPKAKLDAVNMDEEEDLDKIKFLITSINGNPDRLFINRTVDRLVAGATSEIQAIINKHESGLDRSANHKCRGCGTIDKSEVPLEAEFFKRSL